MTLRRGAASWIAGALLFAFGVIRIAHVLPARAHENDFAHYYVTSRLWLDGRNPYTTPFAAEFARYGFHYDGRIPTGTNPPALVAAFAPVALLPPTPAFVVWVAIQMVSFLATLAMIASMLHGRVATRHVPLLLGLLAASNALYFHFYFSQVQLPIGALLLGAYMLHRSGRHSTALALASAAALLKLFPAALLPWFVLTTPGSWKRRIAFTLPSAALAIATVACTWPLWPGFLHFGSAIVRDAVVNQTFDFSLPSFIMNVGTAQRGFAASQEELAVLWRFASAAAGLLVALTYVPLLTGEHDPENDFCMLLLVSAVASPTAWGHYFVLGFFPFSVFCARMLERLDVVRLLAIGVAFAFTLNLCDGLLLPASISARINGALPFGWRVFFAYFPLYGVLGLTFWFRSRRALGAWGRAAVPAFHREGLV